MSNSSSKGGNIQSILAAAVIPIAIGIGFVIWKFIMGDPSGFEDSDINKNPLPNHIMATMYKGGVLVPVWWERSSQLWFFHWAFYYYRKIKGTETLKCLFKKSVRWWSVEILMELKRNAQNNVAQLPTWWTRDSIAIVKWKQIKPWQRA